MKKIIYIILAIAFIGILFIAANITNFETQKETANSNTNSNANNNSADNSNVNNAIENETTTNQVNENNSTNDSNKNNENNKNEENNVTNKNIVTEVNESNFKKEVLESEKPVLIDFYATWCGPCRYLSPILEEIARENDKIKVVKINVDKNEGLSYKYKAFSLPTVVLMKNGKEVTRFQGAAPKEAIVNFINQFV